MLGFAEEPVAQLKRIPIFYCRLMVTFIWMSNYTCTLQPYFNAIVTRVSPLCIGASANVTNARRRRSPSDILLHCLTSGMSSLQSSSLEPSFPKTYVRASTPSGVKLLSFNEVWAWSQSESLYCGMRVLRTRCPLTGWHIVYSMHREIIWLHTTFICNNLYTYEVMINYYHNVYSLHVTFTT